jgi:hypothetical protein
MSQLRVNAVTDETGGNTATINSMTPTAQSLQGFRNRILNGGMVIDQRNAGASVTIGSAGNLVYTLDRWAAYCDQNSKFSVQQTPSGTGPTGFSSYLGATSLSAYSVGASEAFGLQQTIEGFNTSDLAWGTASASAVTLSFMVYTSLTGTFGGALRNGANNRSYPFSYTVSSANTWTSISITIPGDTTGTWLTNNSAGIRLWFSLGAGSTYSGTAGAWAAADYITATGAVSVVGTSGATFYLTGVQLEAGSVATPFERRPYGTELALCQRYFQFFGPRIGAGASDGNLVVSPMTGQPARPALPLLQTPMRASPSVTVYSRTEASGFLSEFSSYSSITISSINNVSAEIGGGWAQASTNPANGLMYRATYSAEL